MVPVGVRRDDVIDAPRCAIELPDMRGEAPARILKSAIDNVNERPSADLVPDGDRIPALVGFNVKEVDFEKVGTRLPLPAHPALFKARTVVTNLTP